MKTETESCATLNLLHILGKRWSIPVIESISALGTGTSFNAVLLSLEEITPRGLSTILGEFSDAGIVKKSEYKKKRSDTHQIHAHKKRGRTREDHKESEVFRNKSVRDKPTLLRTQVCRMLSLPAPQPSESRINE